VVVEAVLVGVSESGKHLDQLLEIDGPSPSSAYRWNEDLLAEQVREWVLRRLRGAWKLMAQGYSSAKASAIQAARYLAEQMHRKVFSPFLQLARLAHMIRYAE
jgi:hypothetical protein